MTARLQAADPLPRRQRSGQFGKEPCYRCAKPRNCGNRQGDNQGQHERVLGSRGTILRLQETPGAIQEVAHRISPLKKTAAT